MPLRNIYVSYNEETTKSLMSGNLDVEYTGEIYYEMHKNENGEIPGYDYSPADGDVFYGCSCEFKEIKSFKKVEKK